MLPTEIYDILFFSMISDDHSSAINSISPVYYNSLSTYDECMKSFDHRSNYDLVVRLNMDQIMITFSAVFFLQIAANFFLAWSSISFKLTLSLLSVYCADCEKVCVGKKCLLCLFPEHGQFVVHLVSRFGCWRSQVGWVSNTMCVRKWVYWRKLCLLDSFVGH